MREVTISSYCDKCAADGQREAATISFVVGIVVGERNRPQLRVVELCEPHGKEMDDMRTFVVERGAAPDTIPAAPAPRGNKHPTAVGPCPACGHMSTSPKSMQVHVYRVHLHAEPPPSPTTCPDCGQDFASPTACGVHRRVVHDRTSADDAYAALAAPARKRARKPT